MCEGRQNSLLYSLRSREVGRRRHETRNFLDTDGCISRLYLRKKLEGHRGCVNTVEYNEEGTLIVSGSDDTQLRLWCASTLREVAVVDTGHSRNIFCAKLVPNTNNTRAISCGADGEIRLSCVDLGGKHTTPGSVLESGLISNASPTLLHSTARLALSLVFLPLHPSAFLGTSQDGCIRLYDLRQDVATASSGTFLQMEPQSSATSLAFNPLDPYSFVMGAEDPLIRVYDIRRPPGKELLAAKSRILQTRAPPELLAQMRSGRMSSSGVSGVDFNRFGEVLATYRNDDMYLFNIKDYAPERVDDTEVCMAGFVRFSGHRNQDTFLKNAKFLGQGRFVATGSDCGHLFIWNKASGALVRKIRADAHVVNGLAPHPYLPLVVTCGIDSDVKVLDLGEDKPAPPRTPSQAGGGRERRSLGEAMRSPDRERVVTPEEGERMLEEVAALRARGNSLFKAKQHEEAAAVYQECCAMSNFVSPTEDLETRLQAMRVLCLGNLAACQLHLKQWATAQQLCSKVLAVEPNNLKARYRRAQAAAELQEFHAAKTDVEAGLQIEPENSDLRRLLVEIQKKKEAHKLKESRIFSKLFQ